MIVSAVSLFFGGMFTNSKLQRKVELKCPECPSMKCPPNVSVNSLSMEELRKMKIRGGFTYSPVFNGEVIMLVDPKDTVTNKR